MAIMELGFDFLRTGSSHKDLEMKGVEDTTEIFLLAKNYLQK